MGDFFPEQKGGSAPVAWFFGVMALLICVTSLFVSLAMNTNIFEGFWTVLVFIFEVIDELWEK